MSELIHEITQDFESNLESHPHLILGQLERVGSTFYLDMLEKTNLVHNEPYKQLVPNDWSIARGFYGKLESIDEFLSDNKVDDLHKIWLKNFVLSRYEPKGQILKETNLYFAVNNLLDLFPHRSVEVLTRNPLGIISSFKRNNLFERWNYSKIAETLEYQSTFLDEQKSNSYENFFKKSDNWQERLIWLIGLNSLLLSEVLEKEDIQVTKYQDLIQIDNPDKQGDRNEESIFATNVDKKHDDFPNRLSQQEINLIVDAGQDCIQFVESEFDNLNLFKRIFGEYFENIDYKSNVRNSIAVVQKSNIKEEKSIDNEINIESAYLKLDPESGVEWAASLVSNLEMCDFLNDLIANGLDVKFLYLFLRADMPTDRGGRLQFNNETNRIDLVEGFESHPAYWITWLSSAMYAAYKGKYLPKSEEWITTYRYNQKDLETKKSNHSYANDDTVPTGILENGIPRDFFGNLKIWCEEWSNNSELALSKKIAGISWKHYLHSDYQLISEKPFLTNSRIIGSRLVNRNQNIDPINAIELVEKLSQFTRSIDARNSNHSEDIGNLNRKLANLILRQ